MKKISALCLLTASMLLLCGYKSEDEEPATITDAIVDNMHDCERYYPTCVIMAAEQNNYDLPGVIISEPFEVYEEEAPKVNPPQSEHLTRQAGVFYGPSGKETYYNLKMNKVVEYMRSLGYSEEEYPYWVRSDGVKMFGEYVMVAADLSIRPKGTIIETSLGTAIVVDTGGFAKYDSTMLDVATAW